MSERKTWISDRNPEGGRAAAVKAAATDCTAPTWCYYLRECLFARLPPTNLAQARV